MAESSPVDPGPKPDKPTDQEAGFPDLGGGLDEDILADIERSLGNDIELESKNLGEKVELDKADLPLIWDDDDEEEGEEPAPPEEVQEPEEPQTEVEVDLAGKPEPPAEDPELVEEAEPQKRKPWLLIGLAALLLLIITAAGGRLLFGHV